LVLSIESQNTTRKIIIKRNQVEMAIVKSSPVGGCCSYSKMRFFGISISLFIFGLFIWATEGIATTALFLNNPSWSCKIT